MIQKNNDEIPLRVLLLRIGSFFKYLLSKWIILLLAGIIGGALGLLIAIYTKPTYSAKLTFVLSSGSKEGGLSALVNQFGIDAGSGGNDVFSGENILTLFKSKRMIEAVLFKKPPGSNEILANIIVREWEWDRQWKKSKRTKNQFPFPAEIAGLSLIQDSLLREVYSSILKNNLTVLRTDKKLSVYEVNTRTTNELFSCYLTRYLMDETANFYIETKTSLAKLNLRMLQKEADSLRGQLGGAISSTASEVDRTFALNPALQLQRAPAQKSQIRATVLATAYGEVVKNLEIAKITLQRETPIYQIIDVPEMPLKIKKVSKLFSIIVGGGVVFLLITIYLFIRRKFY
ncbi:MAG: hypothetical protein ABIN97_12885 [Ginsengibacter sp.]